MSTQTFRPRIEDPSGDLDERVRTLADERGWTHRRAYAKLLENGLSSGRQVEVSRGE